MAGATIGTFVAGPVGTVVSGVVGAGVGSVVGLYIRINMMFLIIIMA